MVDSEFEALIRAMPKAEIHLHLEGTIDIETLLRLIGARGEPLGDGRRASLASLYSHRDFRHFLENFRAICSEIRCPEDFALIATSLAERLHRENVVHAEVMCSPGSFVRAGLPAREVMDAVSGATRRYARGNEGPSIRYLLDGVRQWGVRALEELVQTADSCREFDVIGIGVGGDEKAVEASELAPAFEEARRLGLHTTAHAGEFDGPRSVWEAMEVLQVERIGHGVRAVEDPGLVRALAAGGMVLECCPTSNLRTRVVGSWDRHPIPVLYRSGVTVTVNSDDPALFETSLCTEWGVLRDRLGLERSEVVRVGINTAEASFLPEPQRSDLVDRMRRTASLLGVEG